MVQSIKLAGCFGERRRLRVRVPGRSAFLYCMTCWPNGRASVSDEVFLFALSFDDFIVHLFYFGGEMVGFTIIFTSKKMMYSWRLDVGFEEQEREKREERAAGGCWLRAKRPMMNEERRDVVLRSQLSRTTVVSASRPEFHSSKKTER
jgi:hypothetical protein